MAEAVWLRDLARAELGTSPERSAASPSSNPHAHVSAPSVVRSARECGWGDAPSPPTAASAWPSA